MEELKEMLIKSLIEKLKNGGYVTEIEFSLLRYLDSKRN